MCSGAMPTSSEDGKLPLLNLEEVLGSSPAGGSGTVVAHSQIQLAARGVQDAL